MVLKLPEQKLIDARLANCVISQDKTGRDTLIQDVKIPSEVADKLWTAFKPREISPEGLLEAQKLSDYVPTLDEFKHYIKTLNPARLLVSRGFRT